MDIFDFWLNPSKRVTKYFKKENAKDTIQQKLHKTLKQKEVKAEKVVTHKSVFIKTFASVMLFFLTIILMFIFFHEYKQENIVRVFKFIREILSFLKMERLANAIKPATRMDTSIGKMREIIFMTWLVFTLISVYTYLLSFYCFPSTLKVVHLLFVVWEASAVGLLLSYIANIRFFRPSSIFLLLFVLPSVLSILILSFVTYLYKSKKIIIDEKFRHFLKIIFIFFWAYSFLGLNIAIFKVFSNFAGAFVGMILSIILSLFAILVGSLMWINILQQIDFSLEQKVAKKYEYLLINLLFNAFLTVFINILSIILEIITYLKVDND